MNKIEIQNEKEKMFLDAVLYLEEAKDVFQGMFSSVHKSMTSEQLQAIQTLRDAYSKTLGCYQSIVMNKGGVNSESNN